MGQRSAAKVRCLGQIIAYFSSKLTHITQCNDHQGVPNEYKQKEEGGGDRCIIELFSRAQRTLTSSASTRSTTFDQIFYSFSYNLANVCKKKATHDTGSALSNRKLNVQTKNQQPQSLLHWPAAASSEISECNWIFICFLWQSYKKRAGKSASWALALAARDSPLFQK